MKFSAFSIPAPLLAGAVIACIEAVIACAVAVSLIVGDLRGNAAGSVVSDTPAAHWIGTGTAVFILVLFGTMFLGAISIMRGKVWGRTPIVMMQALLIPVAWYMCSESMVLAGILVGVAAVACLVCTLHPRSSAHIASLYRA